MSAQSTLYTSSDFLHYATIAADKDIKALDPKGRNRLCRRICAKGAAGNIVVTRGDGAANVTLAVLSGVAEDIQVKTIVAVGTTATEITVYW
jgi:hypothetical protein